MASRFEKVSTRMFCISGVLSDIYCLPDLKILSFEELLNIRLHELGYRSVIFYSGAKGQFTALDRDGIRGLSYCLKRSSARSNDRSAAGGAEPGSVQTSSRTTGAAYSTASETATAAAATASPTSSPGAGIGRKPFARKRDSGAVSSGAAAGSTAGSTAGSAAASGNGTAGAKNYIQKAVDESAAAEYANNFIGDTTEPKALVFASLEDFVNNSRPEGRRRFFAYFEDWKSLPNENRNIVIFISKSVNAGNLQQMFSDSSNIALQSLFIKGMNSSGAEFDQNSGLIVGSPLGDEIGSLLEYLRIAGYSYVRRGDDGEDRSITARLMFRHTDKERLVRALSFYSREADFSELKSMKESLESFMYARGGEIVWLTPEDIPLIYSQSASKFSDNDDPLERLKNTAGWEPAYNVINSFVVSHRSRHKAKPSAEAAEGGTAGKTAGVERLEPERAARASCSGKVPNFVLQGPPGVGKTEIANLIGQILQREGILRSGHTVVGSRDKLVGQYVGSTAIQTAAMIEQAQEGVLLIDEVYNLAEGGRDNSHGANYSAEAINTLVAAMTNKNNRFCVIFAGYASRMDEVWGMNEGLFSRFGDSNIIDIEGYKPELLQHIFEKQFGGAEEDSDVKTVLSEDVEAGLPVFFENLYAERDRENFANARDMNMLAASVRRTAGYRCIRAGLEGDIEVIRSDFGAKEKLFEKKGLSAEDIYSKIYEYVGLDFLVEMFNDQLALKIECEEKGIDYPGPSHMIWCGNPGTGKSTAAQLTIDLYHSLGILGGTKPIYVDASEIMSSYVGGGAEQIRKKMDEACQHNTVLVIEEAYQLTANSGGREIINAMLNRMESDRKNFNVIFILYTSLKDEFLRVNPGMASRVLMYEFRDYDGRQLSEIFLKMCEKNRDEVSGGALAKVKSLLSDLYGRGLTVNGNARIVRKLTENMRQNRYRRMTGELAMKLYGSDDAASRGKVSALRSMGKLELPEKAYTFEESDVPEDFNVEVLRQNKL